MGGRLRIPVSLLAAVSVLVIGAVPAAAQTYTVSSYPYSVART